MRRLAFLALLGLLATGPAAADATPTELVLGSVPMDVPATMHRRMKPLADYLAGATGRPVRLRLSADFAAAVEELAAGRADIAYLSPLAYLRAHERGGAQVIAATVTRGRNRFRLVLATRDDSAIRSPRDLVGRRFALGDEHAYLQRAVLRDAGLRLEQFGSYRFLGHFDNIARGIVSGDFDAGILKDTTAWQWESRGLRVFHSSPELPPYNIAVRAGLDAALTDRIQAALLRLRIGDPQGARVIRALDENYDGFSAASDRDYDEVRRLVGPLPP